jgi:hypothetical protein
MKKRTITRLGQLPHLLSAQLPLWPAQPPSSAVPHWLAGMRARPIRLTDPRAPAGSLTDGPCVTAPRRACGSSPRITYARARFSIAMRLGMELCLCPWDPPVRVVVLARLANDANGNPSNASWRLHKILAGLLPPTWSIKTDAPTPPIPLPLAPTWVRGTSSTVPWT